MSLHRIRHMVSRITARMAENRRRAACSNREFLEFWQTHHSA
ncbi:MAG TPA: hypothetical protein VI389_04575 [Geobacteraceae bacterium]